MSRVEFPDRLCPDLRKGQECKYGKDCRFSHEKKKFGPDGKLKGKGAAAVGGAAGDQNKAGAGPEGLDWEPPGGLGEAGCVSRPAGGAPNLFGYAVWLGKVGAAEPEGELAVAVKVNKTDARSGRNSISRLADLPPRWWVKTLLVMPYVRALC